LSSSSGCPIRTQQLGLLENDLRGFLLFGGRVNADFESGK